MDISSFDASGDVVIDAPPEPLYDFIADMPAMGEISPWCTGGEWESDERGVGAFFVGSNAMGERTWQARMRVCEADRPREYTSPRHKRASSSSCTPASSRRSRT